MAGHGSPPPEDRAHHPGRKVYKPTHEVWSESDRAWFPLPEPGVSPGLDRLAAVGNPTRPIGQGVAESFRAVSAAQHAARPPGYRRVPTEDERADYEQQENDLRNERR